MKKVLPIVIILLGVVLVAINVIKYNKDKAVNIESVSSYLEKKYLLY